MATKQKKKFWDDAPTIEYGYCKCGCGMQTNKKYGKPYNWVWGHNPKKKTVLSGHVKPVRGNVEFVERRIRPKFLADKELGILIERILDAMSRGIGSPELVMGIPHYKTKKQILALVVGTNTFKHAAFNRAMELGFIKGSRSSGYWLATETKSRPTPDFAWDEKDDVDDHVLSRALDDKAVDPAIPAGIDIQELDETRNKFNLEIAELFWNRYDWAITQIGILHERIERLERGFGN